MSSAGSSFIAVSVWCSLSGLQGRDVAEGTEDGFIEAAVKGVGSEEFNFQTRRDEEGAKIPRDLGAHKEIAGQPGAEG